jgi:hypothetical protein
MSFTAGLFKKRKQAFTAYQALQETGFTPQDLTFLMRKRMQPPEFQGRASLGEVIQSAGVGGLIAWLLGAIFALLVGTGVIPVTRWLPTFIPGNARMFLNLAIITVVVSTLIGILMGAAVRLIRSADQAAITDQGVKRGGLLLVVNTDDTQKATARLVLQENGAVDVENLTKTWDPAIWSRYKGVEAA